MSIGKYEVLLRPPAVSAGYCADYLKERAGSRKQGPAAVGSKSFLGS